MGVFDVSLGPLLIGTILNVTLLGMMFMQVYLYFSRFWGKDQKWINYMVLFLLIADVLNSGLDVAFVYQYTITRFGNMQAIQVSDWVFNSGIILGFLRVPVLLRVVCGLFIMFFACDTAARRVRLLTGKRWLFFLLLVSIIIQFLMGVATSIATTIVKIFADFQRFRVIVIIWLVLSSVTDGVIAATLVWFLRSHRTGYSSTDGMLSRLTRITVETGLITAVWATVDLIVYLAFPNSLHLIFNLPLGKLYTNSLLSTLNSRVNWSQDPGALSDSTSGAMGLQRLGPQGAKAGASGASGVKTVVWTGGEDGKKARPESVVRSTRENGILITSSTIIHRDDEYDLTDTKLSLGRTAFVQSPAQDDARH